MIKINDLSKNTKNLQKKYKKSKLKMPVKISSKLILISEKEDISKIEKQKVNFYKIKYQMKTMFLKQHINRIFNIKENFYKERVYHIKKIRFYHNFFKYNIKTLHLAISYMDLVFSRCEIKNNNVNLIIYTSLNLAAKFYERKNLIPNFKQAIVILDYEYNQEELANCENVIFGRILEFNLNLNTPFCFLSKFFFCQIIEKDLNKKLNKHPLIKKKIIFIFEKISFIILDYTLNFYECYEFFSSAIAAICIFCTRKILGFSPWNGYLSHLTEIKFKSSIQNFANFILKKFLKDNFHELNFFLKKYQLLKIKIKNYNIIDITGNKLESCQKKKNSYSLQKILRTKKKGNYYKDISSFETYSHFNMINKK